MSNFVEEQRKISINELPREIPDFTASYEPKESLVKKWIMNWIKTGIAKNTIKENDLLPKKSELSDYLGVSVGTVQNAIRYVEDQGLLKSKQRLGTMISNSTNPINAMKKSTSKRDNTIEAIKNIILSKNYKIGSPVPSARILAEKLNVSQNTVRLAYEYLTSIGILQARQVRGKEANWILVEKPNIPIELQKYSTSTNIISETLVSKLTDDLKVFFAENYNVGDKIPSHEELADKLNVSVKTIHDCIKNLSDEGILLSKRGRYGTILMQNPYKKIYEPAKESTIFASAEEAAFYSYQKIENSIVELIKSNYKAGDKLPSMAEFSKIFDVSTNTIRKALNNLSQQGYVTFGRGRFGGTFLVDDIEDEQIESYQWLSINPDFIQ